MMMYDETVGQRESDREKERERERERERELYRNTRLSNGCNKKSNQPCHLNLAAQALESESEVGVCGEEEIVRGGPTRPHRPRLVASHSTRPLSSLPPPRQLLHGSCSNKQQRSSRREITVA